MTVPRQESEYSDSLWEEYAEVAVADVVVDVDAPDLQPSYSYRVPDAIQNELKVGDCVHISFAGREVLGYVLTRRKLAVSDPLCAKLKPILARLPDVITINPEQIHTIRWMSEHYVCNLLDALRCVAPATLGARVVTTVRLADFQVQGRDVTGSMPQAHLIETLRSLGNETELETLRSATKLPGFNSAYSALLKKRLLVEEHTISRARTVGKTIRAYSLGAAAEVLHGGSGGRRSPQQQRLLNQLLDRARQQEGPMPADELLHAAQANPASLKGLLEKGLVVATEQTVRRAPVTSPARRTDPPRLTEGQTKAVEQLKDAVDSYEARTVLLFGVTASGKTEVYLQAIAHTLQKGRNAIVLVPEIALTAQVVDVFVGRFGDQVAVLHSRLSEGERHDEWRRMQEGDARIVIGARSAIFAPVDNVGLIVVDEEHETSYKQENTPRYNAKELARERARLSRATLLLGSATPSLETYFASESPETAMPHSPKSKMKASPEKATGPVAEKSGQQHSIEASDSTGKVQRIEMLERIDNRPLPKVHIIDLREEFKQRRALFAQRLVDAMADRLARKQQIILFLNRRGYAQFVLCRDCGYTAKCPNCAVSLAFHVYDRTLKCHHCDYSGRAPHQCPECGSAKVKAFGIGTEKVEEEALRLFPGVRMARMDRDTTARKGDHARIVRSFRQGDADILIGTQMVAKGLDFPNVTLVGVVSADTAINMPDFRAAERTFQLLTQVAGRAGRGTQAGEVLIQTFSPDHYAVQTALKHDYPAFYAQEIVFRRELGYPPFRRFANLICADEQDPRAQARAVALATVLQREIAEEVELIGPAPSPLARLKNQYRYHVALRAPLTMPLAGMIRRALEKLPSSDRLKVYVDMDPVSMA